jgi:hypothetical protein
MIFCFYGGFRGLKVFQEFEGIEKFYYFESFEAFDEFENNNCLYNLEVFIIF